MGIRFDKDSRRATNGPLIFFSDNSSYGAFAEEVRGAILSGLSFYGYRFPGSAMVSFGSSEGYMEGIGEPGFVVGMFDYNLPIITIPYKAAKKEIPVSLYDIPKRSTTFDEYSEEVESIIRLLKGNPHRKVVAARVILNEESIDIADLFFNLCRRFPEAYIFCFSTPATGCWIGASPELLLEGSHGSLHSMALAGTRPSGTNNSWDIKNIEEQQIVVQYILDVFQTIGLTPQTDNTFTKITGSIEHICTPITANITMGEDTKFDNKKLEALLKLLSPTPALCGNPKEMAFKEIKILEKFDRGCYGGFCGPFHSINDFTFNVVLRCASVDERKYCIYTGGGITERSVVADEWEETKLKALNTFGKE